MTLESLLKGVQVLAVVDNQYGDGGKGKFIDLFASTWADVIVRCTGGSNAGHTVVIDKKKYVLHLLPSGILHAERVVNQLGQGMVIHLPSLSKELDQLDTEHITYSKNLQISRDAQVVLPWHIAEDVAKNKSQKNGGIGSTGRGIGPAYEDKAGRRGVRIADLYDTDVLAKKLHTLERRYKGQNISAEQVMEELRPHAERIKEFVLDTGAELKKMLAKGKRVGLEGAQGLLLSSEHGTYPFVTSSDCSVNGTASGASLSARHIDTVFGIVKFPVMSRVGAGPFTTEIGGKVSEVYCAEECYNLKLELQAYNIPFKQKGDEISYNQHHPTIVRMMNSEHPLTQSFGLRLAMNEFGSSTKRPRRLGWTDIPVQVYANRVNGPHHVILTKADAIAGIDEFRLAVGYNASDGSSAEFSRDCQTLSSMTPVFKTYKGFDDFRGATSVGDVPSSVRHALRDFERLSDSSVAIISTGPDQSEQVILKRK